MIRITHKDYNEVPEPLTRNGAYRKIDRAVRNRDGEIYNGYYYKHDDVRNKLKAYSVHRNMLRPGDKPKCYYCESTVEHVAVLQIEHYRPKAKVDDIDNNNQPHDGYHWLGLEWSNLLLSCPNCNGKNAKGNRFPIRDNDNRAVAFNPIQLAPRISYDRANCLADCQTLMDEDPLLINPELEDPSPYLTFNAVGQISGIGAKGNTSVARYGLRRGPLLEARQEKIVEIINDIKLACGANLRRRAVGDSFIAWLELSCQKVLDLDNIRLPYCLWGRYVIANFEECVIAQIDEEFKDSLRQAFNNVKNQI